MATFTVLSGESFTVEAESEDEALEKFFAYNDSQACSCGKDDCGCVEWAETLTEVV